MRRVSSDNVDNYFPHDLNSHVIRLKKSELKSDSVSHHRTNQPDVQLFDQLSYLWPSMVSRFTRFKCQPTVSNTVRYRRGSLLSSGKVVQPGFNMFDVFNNSMLTRSIQMTTTMKWDADGDTGNLFCATAKVGIID